MTAPTREPVLRTWHTHPMEVHVLRLTPGADLKAAIDAFAVAESIDAGVVLTCVGSLRRTALRLATKPETVVFENKYEIVSLVGTVSLAGSHLHIALADEQGTTIGGHLKEGSIVFTTAEIAIGMIEGAKFSREHDPETEYSELVVRG